MNNKIKLLRILEILKDTDIDHPINTKGIIAKLRSYGITAERKSIMRDIETISLTGEYDIRKAEPNSRGWYMLSRELEDHELKLIADCIMSGKYLSEKDSTEITQKIIRLASPSGKELIRSSLISEENRKICGTHFLDYFSLIIQAIKEKKKITFRYCEITVGNKLVHRHNGKIYKVSPYYTVLYENEYFLIANTDGHDNASHYRIELMDNVSISDEDAQAVTEISGLNENGRLIPIEKYLRSSVKLWSGEIMTVKLRCENCCRLVIIKNFGSSRISDNSDDTFDISIDVTDTKGFYKFLAQLGTCVKILSPASAKEAFSGYLHSVLQIYDEE